MTLTSRKSRTRYRSPNDEQHARQNARNVYNPTVSDLMARIGSDGTTCEQHAHWKRMYATYARARARNRDQFNKQNVTFCRCCLCARTRCLSGCVLCGAPHDLGKQCRVEYDDDFVDNGSFDDDDCGDENTNDDDRRVPNKLYTPWHVSP